MGWHGIWGTACVACQMWHDGVHGQTEDLCVPTRHPSLLWGRFWAETLFLPFIAPVSKGDEDRQVLRRHSKCTTPSQPNTNSPSSRLRLFWCVRPALPWSDLDTQS